MLLKVLKERKPGAKTERVARERSFTAYTEHALKDDPYNAVEVVLSREQATALWHFLTEALTGLRIRIDTREDGCWVPVMDCY